VQRQFTTISDDHVPRLVAARVMSGDCRGLAGPIDLSTDGDEWDGDGKTELREIARKGGGGEGAGGGAERRPTIVRMSVSRWLLRALMSGICRVAGRCVK